MKKDRLKKELYQLMAQSLAVQSLNVEKRLEMEEQMLGLSESEMSRMIGIFKNEQRELAEMHRVSAREEKEVKKLVFATDALRDAGRTLDKAFLTARESEEREESGRISSSLLDQIDRL